MELVSPKEIKRIFGIERSETEHYGRVEGDQAYIYHSKQCLAQFADLRDCPFAVATQDDDTVDWSGWTPDHAVHLELIDGELIANQP